jgi:hypothetical protein
MNPLKVEGFLEKAQNNSTGHVSSYACGPFPGALVIRFACFFFLMGSRDLEEHDHISLVANWHCCDVFFEL